MHKFYALTEYKGNLFVAKLTVEEFYDLDSQSIKKRGYNLQDIKMSPVSGGLAENTVSTPRLKSGDTYSVADLLNDVMGEFKDTCSNDALAEREETPKVHHIIRAW